MPPSAPSARDRDPDAPLTPARFCAEAGITRWTFDRYVAAGLIEVLRLPSGHRRIRRSEVDRLLSRDTAAVR